MEKLAINLCIADRNVNGAAAVPNGLALPQKPFDPIINSRPRYIPKGIESGDSDRGLHINIHSNTIHNSQRMWAFCRAKE